MRGQGLALGVEGSVGAPQGNKVADPGVVRWMGEDSNGITSAGKDVERWEPSYTLGGNINRRSPYGKQGGGSSNN